ncbi:hypothetical protein FE257_006096 [Aspergillus nanangensis]|uniref:Uncharacterized protein n=1 Tax=Aspergillus nanangensis TaxID=2582783 RepID=A0AAD4GMN6_ASPNN|nr:hypothetical protein FE257_006096 [Aspergillus nanangensis]
MNVPEQCVYYFFCSGANDVQKDPTSILRSWLLQATKQNEACFDLVLRHLNSRGTSTATYLDLWEVLLKAVSQGSNQVLVVDGLDECPRSMPDRIKLDQNRETFVERLLNTVLKTKTRLLIVCRGEDDIKSQLHNRHLRSKFVSELALTKEEVASDITRFAEHVVSQKLPKRPLEFRHNLSTQIADKSDGMFLLIRLQSDGLRPLKTKGQLQRVVNEMPGDLIHVYERNWEEINRAAPSERQRVTAVLRWITFARRPLTLAELVEAVCLFDTSEDGPQYDELPELLNNEYVESEMFRLCSSFVELRTTGSNTSFGSQTVNLIHFSVKEFLSRVNSDAPFADNALQNQHLTRACLQYLRHDDSWIGTADTEDDNVDPPFRAYAVSTWFEHAHSCTEFSGEILSELKSFFSGKNQNWEKWQRSYKSVEDAEKMSTKEDYSPAGRVYYAALFGLNDIIDHLRNENFGIDGTGGYYHTALQATAAMGLMSTLTRLLELRVDVDIAGGQHGSALHAAIARNHLEVAMKLIEYGACLSITDKMGQTPIYIAAREGRQIIAQALFDKGEDITTPDKYGWTPLHSAAANGYLEVVRLLLQHDVDVTVVDNTGVSPLNFASYSGHLEVVRLLLQHNTDVTVADNGGATPLHSASDRGHLEVVRLLLQHNADVTVSDAHGWTPLNSAADNGHLEVIRLLLKYNADVTVANNGGATPLHSAAANNYLEVTRLLLEHNADVTVANNTGVTPLHSAAHGGHLEVDRLLLQHGADVTVANDDGWTPLHSAADSGHLQVVRLLLKHDADPTVPNIYGWSPLHTVAANACVDILNLLIISGADSNVKAADEATPLHIAVQHCQLDSIESLVRHIAVSESYDCYGRMPFHWACLHNHKDRPTKVHIPKDYPVITLANQHLHIKITIQKITAQLLPMRRQNSALLHVLGRSLLFLRDLSSASIAFNYAINIEQASGKHFHLMGCCGCRDVIRGVRYICFTCPQVSLCDACMANYRNLEKMHWCHDHEFLRIPSVEFALDQPNAAGDTYTTKFVEWVTKLSVQYSPCQVSKGELPAGVATTDN